MLKASDLEFRLNEYVWDKTVFVCNTASSLDQPHLWSWHRNVVGDFQLSEDEDFADLSREDLFFLWMWKIADKLNNKIRVLEKEVDEKDKEIRQLERGYYVEEEDEL